MAYKAYSCKSYELSPYWDVVELLQIRRFT